MHEVFVEGGLIRKLWMVESDAYSEHLLRLDPESRRSRFGGAIADDMIRTYAATMRGPDAIVHGYFVDGVLRGAADMRVLNAAHRNEAEAAFSIEKPWQSHGVGSALLERSLLAARNRNIKMMHVCCLPENQRMQQLARKYDAEMSFDFGTVIGKMETQYPTPLSVMRELVVEGHSFAAAYVDFQSRLFKPAGMSKLAEAHSVP
jgi:GNAT superfamily N-acetyltransferase